LMRLFWSVSSLTLIATQLSTNGLFMYANYFCNLSLVNSCFQKAINLVSLFTGKLCVTHECYSPKGLFE
jgi:hypothetical protein